jgi:hypothetical protein
VDKKHRFCDGDKMTKRNEIPETCPLDKTPSGTIKCVKCCYLKELKWGNVHFYCNADRIDKGFPDYR